MKDPRAIRKTIRIELSGLADAIRRLGYRITDVRGPRKRDLRTRLFQIKRLKTAIVAEFRRLRTAASPEHAATLHTHMIDAKRQCRQLEAELR
jgi:hypothetical protein